MKLSAKILTVSIALFSFVACGKINPNATTPNSPGLLQMNLGSTWLLDSVVYPNGGGTNYYASQHPGFAVSLNIISDMQITGSMFCNNFSAGAIWEANSYLYISNYALTNNTCGAGQPANPLAFTQKMYFNFGTSELDISDTAGTFHATFVKH